MIDLKIHGYLLHVRLYIDYLPKLQINIIMWVFLLTEEEKETSTSLKKIEFKISMFLRV